MECPEGQSRIDPTLPCVPEDPVGFVSVIYQIGLGFIGFVALLYLIIGGYHVLTSQGDPAKLQTGKKYIFYAIAGIILAIFGFTIMQIVASGILHIPGFE